jgi:hypothetical protein
MGDWLHWRPHLVGLVGPKAVVPAPAWESQVGTACRRRPLDPAEREASVEQAPQVVEVLWLALGQPVALGPQRVLLPRTQALVPGVVKAQQERRHRPLLCRLVPQPLLLLLLLLLLLPLSLSLSLLLLLPKVWTVLIASVLCPPTVQPPPAVWLHRPSQHLTLCPSPKASPPWPFASRLCSPPFQSACSPPSRTLRRMRPLLLPRAPQGPP